MFSPSSWALVRWVMGAVMSWEGGLLTFLESRTVSVGGDRVVLRLFPHLLSVGPLMLRSGSLGSGPGHEATRGQVGQPGFRPSWYWAMGTVASLAAPTCGPGTPALGGNLPLEGSVSSPHATA